MDDHQRELLTLRQEFNKFDKKDPEAIRKWFADHPYLTIIEHAQVAGKSRWYIRDLRRRAGLTKPVTGRLPKSTAKTLPPAGVEVPANWRDKEWLEKVAKIYPGKRLAKAIGVSYQRLKAKLDKLNITCRAERKPSKNPCCNKAWVHKHYVDMRLSQVQCAKLAGISKENFANWLVMFEIPTRRSTQIASNLWVYKLMHELEAQPVVRTVMHREDHVHVRFQHFIWESYYPYRTGKRLAFSYNIQPEDARIKRIPTVTHQYESDLDGTNHFPHHIQINHKEWRAGSLLERRLAIHKFGEWIFNNKYRQLEHPLAVIEKEFSDIRGIDFSKYVRGTGFTAWARFVGMEHSPGKRIIQHFFDLSEIWSQVFLSPRYITHTLNYLANISIKTNVWPINTHSMLMTVLNGFQQIAHKKIPSIPSPVVYAAILSKLGIKGSVLDLTTGYGERAIACAMLGLTYVYVPNPSFQHAIDRGFADFLKLNHRPFDGTKADLLLCDCGLKTLPDLQQVLQLAKYAKNMLLFVPRHKRVEVLATLPPKSVIPIRSQFYRKTEDYLFLY